VIQNAFQAYVQGTADQVQCELVSAVTEGSERGLSIIAEARLAVENFEATNDQQQIVHLMIEGSKRGLSIIAEARLAVQNNTATEDQQRGGQRKRSIKGPRKRPISHRGNHAQSLERDV
jgi:hypothetical protein